MLRCLAVLFYLVLCKSTMASWQTMTDAQLTELPIIVYGEYVGASVVSSDQNTPSLNLGVIRAINVLKGKPNDGLYFIKGYPPSRPISSDMLFFKAGQTGLWFLQPVQDSQGIYQITHPSQFQNLAPNSAELDRWRALIKNSPQLN